MRKSLSIFGWKAILRNYGWTSFWLDSILPLIVSLGLCILMYVKDADILLYNPQIQISAESETKRSIFREKDKTKRSKKESAQHSKSRNKSFVMTSVSAL